MVLHPYTEMVSVIAFALRPKETLNIILSLCPFTRYSHGGENTDL